MRDCHSPEFPDSTLRNLLVVGAAAVIRHSKTKNTPLANWLRSLLEKKPVRLVPAALADKTARTVWALLAHDRTCHPYRQIT
jgi:transposase